MLAWAAAGEPRLNVTCHTELLKGSDAAYVWLLCSAEALAEKGNLDDLVEVSADWQSSFKAKNKLARGTCESHDATCRARQTLRPPQVAALLPDLRRVAHAVENHLPHLTADWDAVDDAGNKVPRHTC